MSVKVDLLKCSGCGACTLICPVGVLAVEDMKCRVSEGCINCGKCVDICHWRAITLEEAGKKKKTKNVILKELKNPGEGRKPRRPDILRFTQDDIP